MKTSFGWSALWGFFATLSGSEFTSFASFSAFSCLNNEQTVSNWSRWKANKFEKWVRNSEKISIFIEQLASWREHFLRYLPTTERSKFENQFSWGIQFASKLRSESVVGIEMHFDDSWNDVKGVLTMCTSLVGFL